MFRQPPQHKSWISLLIAASLLLPGLLQPVAYAARRKPIVVSFGQPNIWSLEQAHYLLARMHMTNLELQAKALSAEDLNPNIVHGTRIEILKQILDINAQYDQGVGFQNRRIVDNARFNDTRRRELITRRTDLRQDSLALKREIARLEFERARMDTDPKATDEAKALKTTEIEKKKEELVAVNEVITQDNAELDTLSAEPSGTPTFPTASGSPAALPTSALEKLIEKNVDKLLEVAKDPKLNATTMLDNTVQLQYEIIAKQLTLLRDEVGPGERLVFLELPQSIYTTPGDGDEKMAQAWWHVNGYTRTDPLLRLLLELLEIEQKWQKIQKVKAYVDRRRELNLIPCSQDQQTVEQHARLSDDPILSIFVGLKCERRNARKSVLDKLYREANTLFSRVEQNGARDTSEQVEAIRKLLSVTKEITKGADNEARNVQQVDARSPKQEQLAKAQGVEKERRVRIEQLKNMLLKVLSEENPLEAHPESAQDAEFQKALDEFGEYLKETEANQGAGLEKAMEFIRLDYQEDPTLGAADLKRRTIRAIDIIPRQSSLNVNDINDTVKANRIVAGFKFLFGFAGDVNFHRQREQFEQFLHQELYASGFGKGSRDFGWTFGALPGTKRVAPGVRTTFAALVVPEDAESIVMSARGCYFPRKSYQPLDFEDTGHSDWDREDRFKKYNCGDEQNYVLPIPGGGNVSNFWVTNIDYADGRKDGDFVTVSVRGNNFSSQMGVLVDGVPLFPMVGLAQPLLMPRKAVADGAEPPALPSECSQAQGICGRYERIDAGQIVFSFKMPQNYVGIPTITLIAPGKSVDLNSLPNVRINRRSGSNLKNDGSVMFGTTSLSITGLQLVNGWPASTLVDAVLTGTGFDDRDTIYVNGDALGATAGTSKTFSSSNLYRLRFSLPADDSLKVTVVRDKEIFTSSFPNPAVLKVTDTQLISLRPAAKNKPAVMLVKLTGTGFSSRLVPHVEGAAHWQLVSMSPTEMIVKVVDPPALPVVIALTDTSTGGAANGVVQKPKEEEKAQAKPDETKPPPQETKPKP